MERYVALRSVESRLVGDKITNEEAIRPQAVVLSSQGLRSASNWKSKIMLSTYCESKEK